MKPKNILVTGATGFIGSHLCELLLKEGHNVYALARNEQKFLKLGIPATLILGELKHSSRNNWIDELPPDLDVVVHTAGIVHSFKEKEFYTVNYRKTEHLINELLENFPTLHFILLSSLSAQGPDKKNKILKESSKANPVCHYGNSKLLGEIALKKCDGPGWKKTVIRPSMVIGPRDQGVLDVFRMVKSGLVLLPGLDGMKKRYSFVNVFDLNNLIYRAICYPPLTSTKTKIFLAAHPEPVYYSELIDSIKKVQNKNWSFNLRLPIFFVKLVAFSTALINKFFPKIDFRLTPDKVDQIKQKAWVCSSSKAMEELEMQYTHDLESTIKTTYEDYHQRGWI